MSASVVNKGIQVQLGFGGIVSENLQMESASEKPSARSKFLKDENNNRCSQLISNVGKEYTIEGVILDDLSHTEMIAMRALEIGSLISVTPTGGTAQKCTITDLELKFSRTQAMGSISFRYIVDIDPTVTP